MEHFETLISLRDAIASKKVSAGEAVQYYLDRIEAHDGAVQAMTETYAEHAKGVAAKVDAGEVAGPLAGVPIAVKDVLCTTYGKTSCSSKMLANYQSPFTATAVQRLEDAGAIVIGKTNMDEFAMGSSTENSANFTTKNPWDVNHVPGGSSGGSAAAMSADFAAATLGTDTGGSIRQPAALCGIVGFKPTYGRISRSGLVAFASSLDQIGPFTRSVADTALLTQVMSGVDPLDSTSADMPVGDWVASTQEQPTGLKIGIAKQYLSDSNHPAMAQATEEAIAIYKDAGAEIVEVDLPTTEYGIPTYYIVATAEASSNLARFDGVHYGHRAADPDDLVDLYAKSREEGFGPEVKRRIMLGTYALSSGYYDAYYNRALKVRRLIKNDLDQAFTQCDAILCPTTTGPAFKIGDKSDDPLAMYMNDIYTVNANLAGIPGISLPCGFAAGEAQGGGDLPIGVQLLAPAFAEEKLFSIAQIYESATGYWKKRPL